MEVIGVRMFSQSLMRYLLKYHKEAEIEESIEQKELPRKIETIDQELFGKKEPVKIYIPIN